MTMRAEGPANQRTLHLGRQITYGEVGLQSDALADNIEDCSAARGPRLHDERRGDVLMLMCLVRSMKFCSIYMNEKNWGGAGDRDRGDCQKSKIKYEHKEERRFSFLGLFSGFSYTFLYFKRKEKEKKRPRKDQEKTKKRQEKTRKAREWSPRPNSAPTASCPSPPPSLSTLDSRLLSI